MAYIRPLSNYYELLGLFDYSVHCCNLWKGENERITVNPQAEGARPEISHRNTIALCAASWKMDNTRRPGGGGSKKKKWMQRVSRGKLFLLVSTTRQRHFSEKWKQEISHTPVLLSCWRWKSIDNQRTRKEGRKLYTQLRLDGVCVWLLALQESRSNQHGRGARLLMNFSGLGLLFLLPTVRPDRSSRLCVYH